MQLEEVDWALGGMPGARGWGTHAGAGGHRLPWWVQSLLLLKFISRAHGEPGRETLWATGPHPPCLLLPHQGVVWGSGARSRTSPGKAAER